MIYVSAGAYVREVDLSQYAPAISTSILAIEGTAIKGPINELVYINTPDKAIATYGKPKPGMWLSYGLLEYLKRGNAAWGNRVASGSANVTSSAMLDWTSNPFTSPALGLTYPAKRASIAVADAEGTKPYLDSALETYVITPSYTSTYTVTDYETYDIQTGYTNGFRIVVTDSNGVEQTADDVAIPDNIYTASALANWLTNNLTNSSPYITIANDGNGKLKFTHKTMGANGVIRFETPAVPAGEDCYDELGILPTVIGTGVAPFTITGVNNVLTLDAEATYGGGPVGSASLTLTSGTYNTAQLMADEINTRIGLSGLTGILVAFGDSVGRVGIRNVTPMAGIQIVSGTALTTLGLTAGAMSTDTEIPGAAGTDYLQVVTTEGDGVTTHTEEFTLTSGTARTAAQVEADLAASQFFVATAMDTGSGYFVRIQGNYEGSVAAVQITSASTCSTVFTPATATGTGGATSATFYAAEYGTWANYVDADPGIAIRVSAGNFNGTCTIQVVTSFGNVIDTYTNVSKAASQKNLTAGVVGVSSKGSDGAPPVYPTLKFPSGSATTDYFYNGCYVKFKSGALAGQTRRIEDYDGATRLATLALPALPADTDGMVFDLVSENYIQSVINGVTEDSGSAYIRVTDNTANENPPGYTGSYSDYYMSGGANGSEEVESSDFIGTSTIAGEKTGLQLFKNYDVLDINILYCPGCTTLAVYNAVDALCKYRGDVMGVTDPPKGLSPQNVVDWHNATGSYNAELPDPADFLLYQLDPASYSYPFDGSQTGRQSLNSNYMALFWPWCQIYDEYNNDADFADNRFVPPGMFAVAQFAYNDSVAEPWFAAAGVTRGKLLSVLTTEYPDGPDQSERDLLYGNGNAVNPIVNFIDHGILIWGQRTLQRTASSLDRINVRRMLLYAKKLVSTVSMYLVFEPNDPVTWSRFVGLVRPIFDGIKNRRGLYDFRIVCDDTTNTADLINQNTMYGKIVMQPTKTAEIILVDLVLTPTGASFEEFIF